jgi:hypothetical protein
MAKTPSKTAPAKKQAPKTQPGAQSANAVGEARPAKKAAPASAAQKGKTQLASSPSLPDKAAKSMAAKGMAGKPAPRKTAPRKTAGLKAPITKRPSVKAADIATAFVPELTPELAPAAPPRPEVTVFQIYFEPSQRAGLDPTFVPLDNAASSDPLLEFAVFERLYMDEGVRLSPLWGAVSWRFAAKTGLSGNAWLGEIAAHPGFDLYFCNPEPENEGLYANQWHRGLTAHPGFRELSAAVLRAAGHDPAHLDAVTPSPITSSCNYFVGSSAFWSAYLPFVRGIVDSARRNLPADILAALDSSRGDPRGLHGGASYWPFIVERLLPLFLRGPGQGLKIYKVALPSAESKLNAHVKRLREMKDVAHRTRSLWLHSCWLHYRNLFLLQVAGKEWCKENLVRITPVKDVVFL